MKNSNKAITVFLGVLLLSSSVSSAFADASYDDIGSYYGSGYTDMGSYYGSGYSDVGSYYGSGYSDIGSYYGSGYSDIPSSYGSGYSDIGSYYGSGYTDIPSNYGSGYSDIGSYYGSGYTDIPSSYGSGYTDIPSNYNTGYTSPSWTGYDYTSSSYTTPSYTDSYTNYNSGYDYSSYTYPTYTNTNTYTYPTNTTVICSDGLAPVNGSCNRTTTIPTTTTTVCSDGHPPVNGSCARVNTIPTTTTNICSDGHPPVNGSCNRTNTIPTTTNNVCSDGHPPVNGSCARTNTIPTTTTNICSDGLPPVNGTCIRTNTIPTTTNTICSDGLPRNSNGNCVRTTTIPTSNITMCADGSYPTNGSCVHTNTLPVITNTICSDGSYPVNGSCIRTITTPSVTYQTCWDGSTIPLYSVCPAQYKVCANGTSVPVNQTCYYGNTYVPYVPPVTIKFNNVITSVSTEITNASARCNGIGLIASNAPSTGWFEYGETPNLGRETAKANIGSSATAPFSNKLVNLKPSTTYYCRAVMQNQFGTVKGETVAFTTKSTAIAYVKPVAKTTVKVATKTTTKKNEIICVDGQVVTVSSKSAADLLNVGQKLVSLQIEKVSGNLSAGSQVIYKLTLKNLSDEKLSGMTVKVTIPAEIEITNASAGTYDPAMHVLTVTNVPLPAYGEAVINWTGTVAKDASVGASMVTTAYTSYSVPGSQAQDEVTAYVVGSVVPGNDAATTTGAKKVVGSASTGGFLPNSLVEWLALIAIIFIIFVLGRSVYTSYASDRQSTH